MDQSPFRNDVENHLARIRETVRRYARNDEADFRKSEIVDCRHVFFFLIFVNAATFDAF